MAFFSDFQYGFRFFVQLYVIELLGDFNRSGANRAVALDISKAFDSIRHAGLLHNLSLMEFQVRYLALFLHFSVIDGFELFWMESLQKNIQLMLEFPAMGIGGSIRQCRCKCRPMLVLRQQKKNAIIKVFTYAVFLFRFYSIVDNS